MWSVFLWNDPQARSGQKWGLPARENQNFEAATPTSQTDKHASVDLTRMRSC
jgi:hypothetical protein